MHRISRKALRDKDRPLAIFELKRAKSMNQTRVQQMKAMGTIGEILDCIDDAKTSSAVFEAYKLV